LQRHSYPCRVRTNKAHHPIHLRDCMICKLPKCWSGGTRAIYHIDMNGQPCHPIAAHKPPVEVASVPLHGASVTLPNMPETTYQPIPFDTTAWQTPVRPLLSQFQQDDCQTCKDESGKSAHPSQFPPNHPQAAGTSHTNGIVVWMLRSAMCVSKALFLHFSKERRVAGTLLLTRHITTYTNNVHTAYPDESESEGTRSSSSVQAARGEEKEKS
jgi:hypothetical protein